MIDSITSRYRVLERLGESGMNGEPQLALRSKLVGGKAIKSFLENPEPLALKDFPMPLEAGAREETDNDVADVLLVSFKIAWIAFERLLQPSDITNGGGLQ